MKKLVIIILLTFICTPAFAGLIPLRYYVEGTYKNYQSPENLLIPTKGILTGWFEYNPYETTFWKNPQYDNPSDYSGGFLVNLYLDGIRLRASNFSFYYDPSKEYSPENFAYLDAYKMEFDPWSSAPHYTPEPMSFHYNPKSNRVFFSINSPPCCEDRYYNFAGEAKVTKSIAMVSEPMTHFLMAFSFLFIGYRRLVSNNLHRKINTQK